MLLHALKIQRIKLMFYLLLLQLTDMHPVA